MRPVTRDISLLLLGCAMLGGCESCDRSQESGRAAKRTGECSSAADCVRRDPCAEPGCDDGRCVEAPVAEGASCDNGTVCDGVAACDGKGRCIASAPPAVDDGNACTIDSCDPVRGVSHEEINADDYDACTKDACDRRTGHITHESVDIEDGDDCTFDSCDKQAGIQHQRPSSHHTCNTSCGPGFHAASRAQNAQCGATQSLQTFCAPDCGSSFHTCDARCPRGYHTSSRSVGVQCGSSSSAHTFCQKNAGDSFHSCDASCPEGYRKQSEVVSRDCGSSPAPKVSCVKG